MKIRFFTENGEVKYNYEYIPTPLGDGEEKSQVESFIRDFSHHRINKKEDLGLYEYEITGFERFSIWKLEEDL